MSNRWNRNLEEEVFTLEDMLTTSDEEEDHVPPNMLFNKAGLLFNQGKYIDSLIMLKKSLEESQNSHKLDVSVKIIECYIKLRDFVGALDLCDTVESDERIMKHDDNQPFISRFYFTKIIALSYLQRFDKANSYLSDHLKKFPENDVTELRKKIHIMMDQSKGIYDLSVIEKEKGCRFIYLDYNAGCEKKFISEEKGRGMIASKNFSSGDIIMIAKPFMFFLDDSRKVLSGSQARKYTENRMISLSQKIMKFIPHSPETSRKIQTLCNRKNKYNHTEEEITNFQLIRDIIRVNAFPVGEFSVDALRWKNQESSIKQLRTSIITQREDKMGSGLFYEPSFFNHDCFPNCNRTVVDDVLIIVAREDIIKGDEVTINYFVKEDHHRSHKLLMRGIQCSCEVCNNFSQLKDCSDKCIRKFKMLSSVYATVDLMETLLDDSIKNFGYTTFLRRFITFLSFPTLKKSGSIPESYKRKYIESIILILENHNEEYLLDFFHGIYRNPQIDKEELFRLLRIYQKRLKPIFCKILGKNVGCDKLFHMWIRERCGCCKKLWSDCENGLKVCSRCKIVFYCGQKCQRRDWKKHKKKCVARKN